MDRKDLISKALQARENAYAPYSNFCVGAALLTQDGEVFTGCNVENAGFTATNCAERTAYFKAVSEGKRNFKEIVIVGGLKGPVTQYCSPCGVCRQVMIEFCNPKEFKVILAKSPTEYKEYTLEELLPLGTYPGDAPGHEVFKQGTPLD
jgi:cytidine deaminase